MGNYVGEIMDIVGKLLRKLFFTQTLPRLGDTLQGRSDYKATWDRITTTFDQARIAVAGEDGGENALVTSGRHTVDILERFIGINPSDVFLEIGCGVGRVGKVLSPRCLTWIGTDISRQMLRYAAERLKGLENVELIELSTVGLREVSANSVDAVYCSVVFMHLYEWDRYKYVQEGYRVLKPGGRCFFDNIDITSSHGWKVFMDGFSYDVEKRPAHLSMASTGEELETYALRAGFKDVKVHRWDDAWVGVTGMKSVLIDD